MGTNPHRNTSKSRRVEAVKAAKGRPTPYENICIEYNNVIVPVAVMISHGQILLAM